MNIIDVVFEIFRTRGHEAYFGEPVSQLEHALQVAHLAETEGAPDSLIAAALLHDIGHLVHDLPEDIADRGLDGGHEEAGAVWLAAHFGPDVVRPIQLHVAAKRHLCTTDPSYLGELSTASLQSLALQGGLMDEEELANFEADPHQGPALRLRRWDDLAKIPALNVPRLDHYRSSLESARDAHGLMIARGTPKIS